MRTMTDNGIVNTELTRTGRRYLSAVLTWLMILVVGCASTAGNHDRRKPWLVKAVDFTGNASISSSDLLDGMDTRPSRLFRRIKF